MFELIQFLVSNQIWLLFFQDLRSYQHQHQHHIPIVDLIVERKGMNSDLLTVLSFVVSLHHCVVCKQEFGLG